MSLTINHNLMAQNTARNLNQSFGKLNTSTQRLSSGLRINSAADDAAGLAIRELQRADIATLKQGARNANDAVSMLQVMDGALGVIDEKLIRMKELAEQAATGTYDSTQRLMIDAEFQEMKAEIDRIAKATDFNNIKLLCPDFANKIEPGSAVLDYNVDLLEKDLSSFAKIINPSAITSSSDLTFVTWPKLQIINSTGDSAAYTGIYLDVSGIYDFAKDVEFFDDKLYTFDYKAATDTWTMLSGTGSGEYFEFYDINYHTSGNFEVTGYTDASKTVPAYLISYAFGYTSKKHPDGTFDNDSTFTVKNSPYNNPNIQTPMNSNYPNAKIVGTKTNEHQTDPAFITYEIDLDGDGLVDLEQTFDPQRTGNFPRMHEFTINLSPPKSKIHFGTGNDSKEDYYYIDTKDCTARGLGIDNLDITTQDKAQNTLTSLNSAIAKKDSARAYFGAMQNRLENTISNLNIQAESLQASESRISDVDVATEMTEMVKNQILSQSATAMLAQANSLPKMAMQVIGG